MTTDWKMDEALKAARDLELEHELIERAARNGRLNIFIPSEPRSDPYVEVADANPERVNNGCQIYRSGA